MGTVGWEVEQGNYPEENSSSMDYECDVVFAGKQSRVTA